MAMAMAMATAWLGRLWKEPRQRGGMAHRAAPPSMAPTRDRSTSMCCLHHAPALPRLCERWQRLAFLPALPSGRGAGGRGEGLRLRGLRGCRYPGGWCNCNRECGLGWLRRPWLQRATAAHPCAACTMPPRRQGFASVGSGLAFLPALPSGRGAGGRGEGLRLRAVRCCRYPGDCCNCNRECGLDWLRKEPRQHGGMSHRAAPPSVAPTRERSTSLCCLRHAPALPRLRERWERPRLPVSLSLPGEARACAPLARYRRTSARRARTRARSAAGWGLRLAVTSSRYPGPLQLQPGVGARPP